tara:strand:+ start:1514 stop:2011 length:498 start_codon:yes stop_codon:yes gene_type:complete
MKRKSQAALEFLTTYGWAFLVILIMIGALAYFGILRPSRLLPDRCNFGPEVDCQDFQIATTGDTIKVKLKNNVGEAIKIPTNGVTADAESSTDLTCTATTSVPAITEVWPAGTIKDFTFSSCGLGGVGFVAGEKGKVSIQLSYYSVRSGSGYMHNIDGEIFGTVI